MTATKPNFLAKMKDLSEKEQDMVSFTVREFLYTCVLVMSFIATFQGIYYSSKTFYYVNVP